MNEPLRHVPRVLVATVTAGRGRDREGAVKAICDEVAAAGFVLVRCVYVNGEPHFIEQLVSNVSNANEADAIVLLGGTGLGPHDNTCEALEGFLGHKMEGFGEAYRQMLREELGSASLLARAMAGVYNQCLVFAMTGRPQHVQRAMKTLVVPTLADAVDLATGRSRTLA
jgi:molybdenum cofactor biosynthesis protein B